MTGAGQPGIKEVIEEARRRFTTTGPQADEVRRVALETVGRVRGEVAEHPEILKVDVGGSYAKGTWLAGPETDIDIYLRFRVGTPPGRFEEIAKKVGFGALRECSPRLRFSEHPYVEARCDGILINVVPHYNVRRGRWMSSADRSVFHTEYMRGTLTYVMRDDVRLLKAFLKANGLYGAEIARNGFSGYVTETLIGWFGSFEAAVRGFADIRPGTVIGKTTKEFETTISIIDPIDENRNLAAAISDENLAKLVLACRSFLKRPTPGAFDGPAAAARPPASIRQWRNVLAVRFKFEERPPDIIWGQSKKTASTLAKQLAQGGFRVLRSKVHIEAGAGEAFVFFLLDAAKIPPTYVQDGPEFFRGENLDTYIAKNLLESEMMWVGPRGRMASLKRRRHTKADACAREALGRGILPEGTRGEPEVWMGDRWGQPGGTAGRKAAAELISTDATILLYSG